MAFAISGALHLSDSLLTGVSARRVAVPLTGRARLGCELRPHHRLDSGHEAPAYSCGHKPLIPEGIYSCPAFSG